MHLVEAHELYRFFHVGDTEIGALRGVSLELDAGELVAIVGLSGSGKSTLLACLAGLDEPTGGVVTIQGRRLSRRPESERAAIRATTFGILLQAGNLLNHLSLADNLGLAQRIAHRWDAQHAAALLARVGLGHRRTALPAQLSGGEVARAGLAVALATHPLALIADEPTGEVDDETEAVLLELLLEYRASGGALLLATHSPALAARADRMLRLRDGRVLP